MRLRAASQRAELDVDEISLIGERLSGQGSVTARAEGVVRLRYSYVDPDGSPNVHLAQAEIDEDGDWELENDQVPAQLAQCGGYLSIQSPATSNAASAASNWPTNSTQAKPVPP